MKAHMLLKAVIIIGGPQKGTRFRPLSLDIPKPLFPVAGLPIIQHHIEACVRVPELKEILILGYYPASDINQFVQEMNQKYQIVIRYLQEYTALGTAGGLYHFRDQIRSGNPTAFFVMNGDVCGDFPLSEMCKFYEEKEKALIVVAGTEATRNQSVNYGCIVSDKKTGKILHYVEKPSIFLSTLINCGIYLCSLDLFQTLAAAFKGNEKKFKADNYSGNDSAIIQLEDQIRPLADKGLAYVYQTANWWSQLKSAGSAIYANRHCLQLYKNRHPERLSGMRISSKEMIQLPKIIGDVFIHPTAYKNIHHTAVLGPNVSIGADVHIGPGVRIRESIILAGASILDYSLVLYSVVGKNSKIGEWSRVEGTPCDPNPNKPFAKMDNLPLFNTNGKLNPSITILGCNVTVPKEVIILNSIVLPDKELGRSFKNEIIL